MEEQELNERLEALETAVFGLTRTEAQRYLDRVTENMKKMYGAELDNYLSLNHKTIVRAEKCIGA